jgi:hypothetical protein
MRMVNGRLPGESSPVGVAIRAAALLFACRFPAMGSGSSVGAGRGSRAHFAPSDGHHRRRR